MPIFVLFLLDNNLSITQVMILEAWFAAIVLFFEIPTGSFADKHGRKLSIVLAALGVLIACFIYASSSSFAGFFIAETIWGIGISLWSGADTALLYDTLKNLKREKEFKKIYGTYNSIYALALGAGAIIGGFFAVYGLRFPVYMSLIPFGIAVLVALSLKEPAMFRKVRLKYWNHIKEAVNYTARHPRLRFLIIYAATFATMTEIAYYFYQPYFKLIGIPITSFGILFAIIMAVVALGSKFSHKIEPKLGEKTIMMVALLVCAVSLFFVSRTLAFYSVIFIMFFEFTDGVTKPVLVDYMQKHIESYRRATIMSLKNMSHEVSIAALLPLFGVIADFWSIQAAFLTSGIIFAVYFVILAAAFLIFRR